MLTYFLFRRRFAQPFLAASLRLARLRPVERVLLLRLEELLLLRLEEPLRLRLERLRPLEDREEVEEEPLALPPFRPPLREDDVLVAFPRPLPDFFPPPVSLFTVAHARRSASFVPTPRFSYPSSM